jgi:hypothetical protein
VAVILQNLGDQFGDVGFVVDHQDTVAAGGSLFRHRFRRLRPSRRLVGRQKQSEGRAAAIDERLFRIHQDVREDLHQLVRIA